MTLLVPASLPRGSAELTRGVTAVLGPTNTGKTFFAIERMLAHANLILTARQDGRLVGFARSLTDFCFCCYLSDLAVDKACQGQGIGKRLIEETRKHAGGELTTTLLLSAPTAMTFYQGIKMPAADNCFLYRRSR